MIAHATSFPGQRTQASRRETALGITVAICTRGRPDELARAIQSLLRQVKPAAEIIVIDNAPLTDATRVTVGSFAGVRYLKEERAGLDFARNRALAAATQPIVAFLDDDAVADERWAEILLARFNEDAALAACTGRVEALGLAHEGQRIVEANGGYSRGMKRIVLPNDARATLNGMRAPLVAWAVSIGSGCSLAVRRDVALSLGGFDIVFGGRRLPGGDDHDMLWRMLAAGCTIGYEPDALAWHEHRRDAESAYAQIAGHQRGLIAFLTKAVRFGSAKQRLGVLMFLGWRMVKPFVRLVRRAGGRDPLPALVLLRMWWNCWVGLVAYPFVRIRGAG